MSTPQNRLHPRRAQVHFSEDGQFRLRTEEGEEHVLPSLLEAVTRCSSENREVRLSVYGTQGKVIVEVFV